MGICRGTSTRFQYCGKNIPLFGVYPNVCGASPAVFNPNVPKDSGVAMARAKSRRVTGRSAAKLDRVINPDQVAGVIAMRTGVNTYSGVKGEKSLCATSRSGGVGKMFGHGRAKRCYNTGCVCGDSVTDIPSNYSRRTADASDVAREKASQTFEINQVVTQFEATDKSLVGNMQRDLVAKINSDVACGSAPSASSSGANSSNVHDRSPCQSAQMVCRSGGDVCVERIPDAAFQAPSCFRNSITWIDLFANTPSTATGGWSGGNPAAALQWDAVIPNINVGFTINCITLTGKQITLRVRAVAQDTWGGGALSNRPTEVDCIGHDETITPFVAGDKVGNAALIPTNPDDPTTTISAPLPGGSIPLGHLIIGTAGAEYLNTYCNCALNSDGGAALI